MPLQPPSRFDDLPQNERPFVPAPLIGPPLEDPPRRGVLDYIPRWLWILTSLTLVLVLVGSMITLPYYSIGPGNPVDVLTAIEVRGGETYPSRGKLLLTTASVSSRPLTVWEAVAVWLNEDHTVLPAEAYQQGTESEAELDAINLGDMEQSKVSAEVAAFSALGMRVAVLPGASILSVIEGAPADGHIRPGDRIVAVAGKRVKDPDALGPLIGRHRIGSKVPFTIVRNGRERSVTIRPSRSTDGRERPVIGVHVGRSYRLPHEVLINSQDIGGPSGGLVFALSIVEAFTEEDITRGHVVAVTGTIGPNGVVGAVGAVQEKARGARDADADVFIVPKSEVEIARRAAPPSIRVIGVDTLSEAIAKLRLLPRASRR